jgi:hypothetical protein
MGIKYISTINEDAMYVKGVKQDSQNLTPSLQNSPKSQMLQNIIFLEKHKLFNLSKISQKGLTSLYQQQ